MNEWMNKNPDEWADEWVDNRMDDRMDEQVPVGVSSVGFYSSVYSYSYVNINRCNDWLEGWLNGWKRVWMIELNMEDFMPLMNRKLVS